MLIIKRKALINMGIDPTRLCGSTQKTIQILKRKKKYIPSTGVIIESNGSLSQLVILTEKKAKKKIKKWFKSLPKEEMKRIHKEMKKLLKNDFTDSSGWGIDVLEYWRKDMENLMDTITHFETSDYSLEFYMLFENYISGYKHGK